MFIGELLAFLVAILWTISSLASEKASRHYGATTLNIIRMAQAILFIGLTLFVITGSPLPLSTTPSIWVWLTLSAIVGYVISDYYFLKCFIMIGARWGELFMTVAPISAALTGWLLLGDKMGPLAILGMMVTIVGICLSVLSKKGDSKKLQVKLPLNAVIYGLIGGIGQGMGLVFSKKGMLIYQDQIQDMFASEAMGSFYMSFSSTMIRCIITFLGFVVIYLFQSRTKELRMAMPESNRLKNFFQNKRLFWWATLSTITGPFLGVALSLASSLYTSTGVTQTIMSTTPVLILYPSYLLFKTKITFLEVVGAVICVIGVALFFF